MTNVAAGLRARDAHHKTDRLWIDALTNVAGDLRQAPAATPLNRAELLRTTLLSGNTRPTGARISPLTQGRT
jgi:hypothetical protein